MFIITDCSPHLLYGHVFECRLDLRVHLYRRFLLEGHQKASTAEVYVPIRSILGYLFPEL